MIVDGKKITKDILKQVREEVVQRAHAPVVRAVVVVPSAATESYLRVKERRAKEAGMTLEIIRLGESATPEAIIETFATPGADAILVQLPLILPNTLDVPGVLNSIPLTKDVDVLSAAARDLFEKGSPEALLPPVVAAVKEVLEHAHVNPNGKKVAVVGNGWLVGAPCAAWFRQVGAEVTILTLEAGDFDLLKDADIIVSGAGSPGLIRPAMLKEGVVLIDAGTSESGGQVVGDADPACASVASVFTPVPGGVGPIAVACLFRNAAGLAKRHGLHTH